MSKSSLLLVCLLPSSLSISVFFFSSGIVIFTENIAVRLLSSEWDKKKKKDKIRDNEGENVLGLNVLETIVFFITNRTASTSVHRRWLESFDNHTNHYCFFWFFFAVGFLFLSFTAEKFLSGAELSHCEHRPSLNCSQRELSPAPAQNTNTTSRYALSADSHGNISFFRLSRNRHKCIYYSSSTDTWGSELLEAVMEWWQRRQWW